MLGMLASECIRTGKAVALGCGLKIVPFNSHLELRVSVAAAH